MIRGYFGVPGVGKTTILTSIGKNEFKKIRLGRSNYDHIYTINFSINIPSIVQITWEDLATYKFYNSLILIDEITLDADNRKFKDFSDAHRDFFVLHRHLGCDVIYATQDFEKVDAKIRGLTFDLWYMTKSVIPFLNQFTCCKRIYRNIAINEHTSDLVYGYRFCNMLEALFAKNFKIVFRKPLYKYFNSFTEMSLATRPEYAGVPINSIKNDLGLKFFNLLNTLDLKLQKRGKK